MNRVNDVDPMMITWILIVAIIGVLLIVFISIAASRYIKKAKKNKESDSKKLNLSDDEFFSLIGGKDNVISYRLVGSRLTLELKDKSLVNKEGLKNEKFDGIIEMTNKIILVKEDLSKELKALDDLKLN